MKSRSVIEAIKRAEEAFPHVKGMPDYETYKLMEKRYQHMVDDIGELPTLNDED